MVSVSFNSYFVTQVFVTLPAYHISVELH